MAFDLPWDWSVDIPHLSYTGIHGKNIPPCSSGIGLEMAKEGGSGNVKSQA